LSNGIPLQIPKTWEDGGLNKYICMEDHFLKKTYGGSFQPKEEWIRSPTKKYSTRLSSREALVLTFPLVASSLAWNVGKFGENDSLRMDPWIGGFKEVYTVSVAPKNLLVQQGYDSLADLYDENKASLWSSYNLILMGLFGVEFPFWWHVGQVSLQGRNS
jgi:hypothetical protein